MNPTVRCIVAEDEKLFRDALIKLLATHWPELEVVAACEDGAHALEEIAEQQPEVAFLDIRMPGLSGLDVAAGITELSPATQIVFVTAYNQYAIDAFEKGAVDYLLKPIETKRLLSTIDRLKARMLSGTVDPAVMAALIAQLSKTLPAAPANEPLVWLTASTGKESRLIMVEDVLYFQSDNKYTSVVTANGEAILRTPLRELINRLDPNQFKQIHRSTIVNLKAIDSIHRDESGRGTLGIKGRPETLAVSITYMNLFKNM